MTAYVLGGTQAGEEDGDELLVMKLTQIRRSAAPALDEVSIVPSPPLVLEC